MKLGGGHKVCETCGETIFGSKLHVCKDISKLCEKQILKAGYPLKQEELKHIKSELTFEQEKSLTSSAPSVEGITKSIKKAEKTIKELKRITKSIKKAEKTIKELKRIVGEEDLNEKYNCDINLCYEDIMELKNCLNKCIDSKILSVGFDLFTFTLQRIISEWEHEIGKKFEECK